MEDKKIVGITSCAAGIAHTYMAAESLVDAGEELGVEAKIETQGSMGQKMYLQKKKLIKQDVIIIASDVTININK